MERIVRRATPEDAEVFAALRLAMFDAMGTPERHAPQWLDACREWVRANAADPSHALVVVEVDGQVVASACGSVERVIPKPTAPTGTLVLIWNICTFPHSRGSGHARAAFEAVMAWATDEVHAEVIRLNATEAGRPIYEAAGFADVGFPEMSLVVSAAKLA